MNIKKTIAIVLASTLMLTGCGNNLYENHKSNYTTVTSVKGVTFDMPENFLAQATAITSISDEQDYNDSTYLYKNGDTTYLFFNIDSVVVAVETQAGYRLEDANSMQAAIESASLDGIWFTADGKNFDYEEDTSDGVYKMIGTMEADVSITPEVYGTFCGKFAYVSTGDYECAMFVGVVGDSYKDLEDTHRDIIEHIAMSLTATEYAATYTEDIITTETEDTSEETEATALEVEETEVDDTETIPEATEEIIAIPEEEIEATENVEESTEELENIDATESIESTEEVAETEIVETVEVTEVVEVEENTETMETTEMVADVEEEEIESFMSLDSNQGETGNGYSDIYHLMSIGDRGRYNANNVNAEQGFESSYITIEELYTGEDAIAIIKAYCNSGKSPYAYANAPNGYSWHVVRYSLEKSQKELYTNIKIEGLDGERLTYRGVSCTTRTYDIIYDWNSKTDLYCYYAVPNGCKEYMLECGDRYEDTSETACYLINNY